MPAPAPRMLLVTGVAGRGASRGWDADSAGPGTEVPGNGRGCAAAGWRGDPWR
jgi:hypothetical protein